ncbi:MAG: NUDIX domain-containing protein [Armatimonadota bacterium]|nr:NUDIX domain-containing protein [Armatimonadota bacterium]
MNVKNAHCSYCGAAFPEGLAWPRTCSACGNVSYVNPLPVSVVLLPVDDGLLLIRRTVVPQIGKLALPGGFINVGESWQEAGAREVWEETGIRIAPGDIHLFDAQSAPDGTVLIFGLAPAARASDLPPFVPTNETSETVIARGPMELAFSTHTDVAARFWAQT